MRHYSRPELYSPVQRILLRDAMTQRLLSNPLRYIAFGAAAALLLLGASLGVLAFKLVQHRIVSNLRPPHLEMRPEAASDLVYRNLDGEPRSLAANRGKVVFLDLWGTWCIQCVAEMPIVQRLYDHYKSDPEVTFLIVSRMDSSQAVRRYARKNHLDLPFYLTEDQDIPPSMQFHQFPATFIYAKDGSLVAKHVAAADWSDSSVIGFIDGLKAQR
jgi:thiol-disulfide isomerase/thioredoxin